MKSKKGIVFGSVVIIVIIILRILIGGHMFKTHSKEEARNHKYEVSLVKALKNSYEGIEEIKISKPEYTTPPGSWSCDIKIKFSNGQYISYGINHDLNDTTNYGGVMNGKNNKEINDEWKKLHSHEGKTKKIITVTFSNGEEDKQ